MGNTQSTTILLPGYTAYHLRAQGLLSLKFTNFPVKSFTQVKWKRLWGHCAPAAVVNLVRLFHIFHTFGGLLKVLIYPSFFLLLLFNSPRTTQTTPDSIPFRCPPPPPPPPPLPPQLLP